MLDKLKRGERLLAEPAASTMASSMVDLATVGRLRDDR